MTCLTSEIPSEQSTLVNEDIETTYLEHISPIFRVGTTKYGGRGAFAKTEISKGSIILRCKSSVGSTIIKPFRKEVCHQCFQYFYGKNLKFKESKTIPGSKDSYSLFFCSQECQDSFKDQDVEDIFLTSLLLIEKYYVEGSKKPEPELREPSKDGILEDIIASEWSLVDEWERGLSRIKKRTLPSQIPRLSEIEYAETKYIVGVLFRMFKHSQDQGVASGFLEDMAPNEAENLELHLFGLLQSSELDKVKKYPYLLYSYINIYKFIRLTCVEELQQFVTSDLVRTILGRSLSNAFGLWSETSNDTEDKEYFGFAVFPSASFFNHSCSPNIKKIRTKNSLHFVALQDIEPGQELCIDYGNYLNEPREKRRKELKEWFFDCGCVKCQEEDI